MKQAALSIERLREAVKRMPSDALTATRKAALADLEEHGLPTVRDEDWKYTDIAAAIDISNRSFDDVTSEPSNDALVGSVAAIMESIDANWLTVANGIVDISQFHDVAGVDVERFSDSAAPVVMNGALANLNAALLHDGLRVQIHAATEKPLGILFVDEPNAAAAVSQANIEIEIAPGCDAEIIEYQSSTGSGDHYANSVVALQVGQSACASYARIQDRRIGHVQTGRLAAVLGEGAKLNMASYDLGGGLVRNDVDINLGKPGAEADFNGLYLAGEGQHIDNHTRVDHRVGPTSSSQEYRGILNGRCRCVWNGKAIVHEGADGTDANQANHNLLLSADAEIDAKPELEIYADDVKCSHGTTVGQLDETALYYLRTRGLGKSQATEVLTRAFAADLVGRAPVAAAKATIASLVEARLAELIQGESL